MASSTDRANASQTPTIVRHGVVLSTMSTSILLYLTRFNIGFAEGWIRDDLGIDKFWMSIVQGAFFGSYALAQVPSGWLSDRFGARRMMLIYVLGWSVVTAVIGLSGSLASLLIGRLAFGVFQAGAYPTANVVLRRWTPTAARGLASSFVAGGGRVGGALAPVLTLWLVVATIPGDSSPEFQPNELLSVAPFFDPPPSPSKPLAAPAPVQRETTGPKPRSQADIRRAMAARLRHREYGAPLAAGRRAEAVAKFAIEPESESESDRKTRLERLATGLKEFDAAARSEIVPILNAAMRDGELFVGDDFEALRLDSYGERLRKRTHRSPDETTRLRRMTLEATFPGGTKQFLGRGWRTSFFIYGFVGLVVLAIYAWIVRDYSAQHPACNAAEQALIADGNPTALEKNADPPQAMPWRLMFFNWNMTMSSLSQFMVNMTWAFGATLLSQFLKDKFDVPTDLRSWLSSLPMVLGFIGMIIGGFVTDWMVRRFGGKWGRAIPMGVTKIFGAAAFVAAGYATDGVTFAVLIGLMAMSTDLGVPALWALIQEVGGRHAGAAVGWGNMWGNFGAALSPVIFTAVDEYVAKPYGMPALPFWLGGAIFGLSALCALSMDATKPLEPETK